MLIKKQFMVKYKILGIVNAVSVNVINTVY